MQYQPIGVIRSPFRTKEDCPIQPVYDQQSEGRIEVMARYAGGLQDVEGFSHLYLLYHFDRAGEVELVRAPFLDDQPRGIFASRHPCRPNGIGISIVKLVRREGDSLVVSGIDVLDGTPLLDIKPYVPRFDAFADASEGWLARRTWRPKPEARE